MAHRVLLFIYMLVILMPAFKVLDVIAAQSLYLNIINFISTSFLIIKFFSYKKNTFLNYNIKNNLVIVSFLLFFIWCSITVFWSINKMESLRVLTEVFSVTLALINIIIHSKTLQKNTIHFIFILMLLMQFLELSFLLHDYLIDILDGTFRAGSRKYLGLTGNKNIASFSILIKIPVLIYFILKQNKHYLDKGLKILSYLLIFLSSFSLFFITVSRGAQLAFILLILFFNFVNLFSAVKEKKKILTSLIINFKFLAPIIFSLLIGFGFSQSQISINQNISSAFENQDTSTNERLRFYKFTLEIIKDNFFTGTGIGSFELESIEKDRLDMNSYVVPYHTHNDFLEIFSETGILGFTLFYVPIFIIYFLLLKKLLFSSKKEKQMIALIIFLMLSMYLADALINFPFARVIQNINLIFILTLGLYVLEKETEIKFIEKIKIFKSLSYILISLFLLTPLSIYSSYRVFNSARDQSLLLYAFNQQNFKIFNNESLKKIEKTYPNLTLTALPISTIIGLHYYNYDDLESAEEYFREAIKANPYININQSYLGKVFEKKGKLDSAKYFTKYAFEKMPNNPVHFTNYIQVLVKENDTLSIKEAYNKVTNKEKDSRIQKIYLLAMSNLLDKDEGRLVLNDIKKNQLTDDGLKISYFVLELGKERVSQGYINFLAAEDYFKNEDFNNASKLYDMAFENNPLEYPYVENAAISYLRLGELEKALNRINVVIDNMDLNTKNGKAYYIRGLAYLEQEETEKACQDFNTAKSFGFNSSVAINSYCKE